MTEPLPQGDFSVLFAGRLLRSKGVLVVRDAARLARQRNLPVRFTIAGMSDADDPDALTPDEFASLAQSRDLAFHMNVPPAEMPALLAASHAVVLPTIYQEGIPRILLEAAAASRFGIVSGNPGCLAFVENGETGVVLPTVDAEALLDAVTALARDRELVDRLSVGAKARFDGGGFGAEHVKSATLALYR